jgi:hypothetical protein
MGDDLGRETVAPVADGKVMPWLLSHKPLIKSHRDITTQTIEHCGRTHHQQHSISVMLLIRHWGGTHDLRDEPFERDRT